MALLLWEKQLKMDSESCLRVQENQEKTVSEA